ncbi:MAG: STAS/SEC14 domain-containing protein [Pelagibacterales bacterium]|nr:STAS/SEC14 domain-containing protein [Pelagibacterales bacterium]
MATEQNYIELTFTEITTDNNLFCQFDDVHGVLLLDIKNHLNEEDFDAISAIIDPYFIKKGELNGIIINAKKFPYWKGSKNRFEYLNFASKNHRKFKKCAFCMGGFFMRVVSRFAKEKAHPEVKMFKFNQIEEAQDWILS